MASKKKLSGQPVSISYEEGILGDAFTKKEIEHAVNNGTFTGGETFVKAKVTSRFTLDVKVPE